MLVSICSHILSPFITRHKSRYHVAEADGTQSIIFDRLYANTITSIHAKDIVVVPQVPKQPTVICNETVVKGLDVGFKCWDGVYVPTQSGILR